jgi:hypothetical protein
MAARIPGLCSLDLRCSAGSGAGARVGCMIDDASPEPHVSGTPSARAPESCFWPLVALVLVILPQVLVRTRLREGPAVGAIAGVRGSPAAVVDLLAGLEFDIPLVHGGEHAWVRAIPAVVVGDIEQVADPSVRTQQVERRRAYENRSAPHWCERSAAPRRRFAAGVECARWPVHMRRLCRG